MGDKIRRDSRIFDLDQDFIVFGLGDGNLSKLIHARRAGLGHLSSVFSMTGKASENIAKVRTRIAFIVLGIETLVIVLSWV